MSHLQAQVHDNGLSATIVVNHPNGAVSEVQVDLFSGGGTHVIVEAAQSTDCTIEAEGHIIDLEAGR